MKCYAQKAVIYSSPERSVYIGKLEREMKRVSAASTLTLSIDKELELIDENSGRTYFTRCLLTPAGTEVSLNTHDATLAIVFLDTLGKDLSKLKPYMTKTIEMANSQSVYLDSQHTEKYILYAKAVYCTKTPNEHITEIFKEWDHFQPSKALPYEADARVEKVIKLIKDNYAENTSVEHLARAVNLSVPRLTQLFKKVTGTPIRQFRLWQRVFIAAHKLNEGYSLTEAALHAGFSDYAQFSRVYKKLVGASPSAARNNIEIRVLKEIA